MKFQPATEEDLILSDEEKFKQDIENSWAVELRKDIRQEKKTKASKAKKDFDPIDFMIIKIGTDIVVGYIELKSRTFESNKYAETMIDHHKMVAIRRKSFDSGKPIYLAIRFTDKDMVYEYNPSHRFRIEHNGRTKNTRTAYDIKEVEYIPLHCFRELK